MSHELDNSTGEYAIAYDGATPWHKHGTAKPEDKHWTLDQWIDAARVGYEVIRVPAYADVGNASIQRPLNTEGGMKAVKGAYFNVRSDTGAILGTHTHTDRRIEVQPREIMHFVHDFVSADDRFKMAVMGAIRGGAQVWATAAFNGAYDIAGEKHQAYLLARTGFDGSLATHFQMSVVRAVCKNTLAAAFADKRALVTLRHTATFNPQTAAKQLAAMAQSVETYKAVGDAMAQVTMAREQVADFFKDIVGIPRNAKSDEISTRKQNQYADIARAYHTTISEGAEEDSAWAALQAVTRYVDHDRSARGETGTEAEKRFMSAQFGSGDALKGKAMCLLLPLIRDRVPVLAS